MSADPEADEEEAAMIAVVSQAIRQSPRFQRDQTVSVRSLLAVSAAFISGYAGQIQPVEERMRFVDEWWAKVRERLEHE